MIGIEFIGSELIYKEENEMIVMTNNQWKCDQNLPAWERMGNDCSAFARVDGLFRAYSEILPDILAVQESSFLMERLLMEKMESFTAKNGENVRYQRITGGDTPIYYRADKLFVVESGFSLFPECVPGFKGSFNNGRTKSYCYGVFEEIESGKRMTVMSAHLWWKSGNPERPNYQPHSAEARAYQISMAAEKAEETVRKYGCPGLLMGDFNSGTESLCMKTAVARGWTEAHDLAEIERSEIKGHHFCGPEGYRRDPPGMYKDALDHIIVRNGSEIRILRYLRMTEEWFDPISDHYPLYIEAEI